MNSIPRLRIKSLQSQDGVRILKVLGLQVRELLPEPVKNLIQVVDVGDVEHRNRIGLYTLSHVTDAVATHP
jgi:hypothetical protein